MRQFFLLLLLSVYLFHAPLLMSREVQDPGIEELKLDTAPAPTPLQFEEEQLQEYKASPEFDYLREQDQDNWWTRFKRYVSLQYQRLLEWIFGDYEASSVLRFIVQILPYLVLTGVILLAVWIFNRINPAAGLLSEPEAGKVFLSEEEEIIKSRNISELIKEAIEEKNFRLAIRYYFLLILQQLTQKELIAYDFGKTDADYLRELGEKELQQQFKQLTRIYDFVWYGNFEATETQFQRSQREFERMQDLIRKSS